MTGLLDWTWGLVTIPALQPTWGMHAPVANASLHSNVSFPRVLAAAAAAPLPQINLGMLRSVVEAAEALHGASLCHVFTMEGGKWYG